MHVFIDCGSHCGCSTRKYLAMHGGDVVVHCFEPNPALLGFYDDLELSLHQAAAWVDDEPRPLYISQVERQEGSSVMEGKCYNIPGTYGRPVLDHACPVDVQCVDLSQWIVRTFALSDTIDLKLNVEGAEYPILRRMADQNTLRYIRHLYVDWHARKIGYSRARHNEVIERLHSAGLSPLPWNGMEPRWCRLM